MKKFFFPDILRPLIPYPVSRLIPLDLQRIQRKKMQEEQEFVVGSVLNASFICLFCDGPGS